MQVRTLDTELKFKLVYWANKLLMTNPTITTILVYTTITLAVSHNILWSAVILEVVNHFRHHRVVNPITITAPA